MSSIISIHSFRGGTGKSNTAANLAAHHARLCARHHSLPDAHAQKLAPPLESPNPLPAKILLAVLAHPDDESFGTGGTLAHYARAGVAVHLAVGTRGEVGTVDEEHMQGFATIGDLRWAELECAAEKLGLASVIHLGFRDSGMAGAMDNSHPDALACAPVEEVAGRIVRLIRELRPQVVLTHDPIGNYGHPDHIAMQRATLRAFEAAPEQFPEAGPAFAPTRLYYSTFGKRWVRLAVRLLPLVGQDPEHFGRNKDIDLKSLAGEQFPITTVINIRDVADVKAEASACHRSQLASGPPSSGLSGWILRRMFSGRETYMRAIPPFEGREQEDDFFAGL